MGELRKVYLPRWLSRVSLALLVPMWCFVTYRVFFAAGDSEPGVVGWAILTVVFGIFAVIFVLMGRRELPAYLLETDGEDRE